MADVDRDSIVGVDDFLQVLYDWEELDPELVICPAATDTPAHPDEDGHIVLMAENCSFAYRAQRSKTIRGALASDDSIQGRNGTPPENHRRGMNVVYGSGRGVWLPSDELPQGRSLPVGLVGNHD